MKNLIQPEGGADKDLETYRAGLQENAKKEVRNVLASGAGEAEIAEYFTSLGLEPEDEIGPPEGQPPVQRERSPIHLPSTPPDRTQRRTRGMPAEGKHERPPGVQGANTGYWQAGGVTRAGAKRSKRP
jgi:hypothetical protein